MAITMNDLDYVREHVRQVPDFPKPGILFLDITTATKDAKSMNKMMCYRHWPSAGFPNSFSLSILTRMCAADAVYRASLVKESTT